MVANKKVNWTVRKDEQAEGGILEFEQGGKVYKTGEKWRLPDGWELDTEYMATFSGGRPAFIHEVAEGYEVVDKIRRPVMVTKRVLLPVE